MHKSVIFPAYPIWSALDATWYVAILKTEISVGFQLYEIFLTTKKLSLALIQHKHEHTNTL